jgi:hypothetical protein
MQSLRLPAYQGRLLTVFETMVAEYDFHAVDTSATIQTVSDQIKALVAPLLVAA